MLKADFRTDMEECIITPYYVQDDKRMELYQYEFYCTNEVDFEEFILKLTGKEKIGDISEEIWYLRRKCFSTFEEPNGLVDFLTFLFDNEVLIEEIKKVFGNYIAENLYAVVY